MNSAYALALSALEKNHKAANKPYKKFQFLLNDFDEDVWRLKFGSRIIRIDWRVKLGDKLLTHRSCADLLEIFKAWISMSTMSRRQIGHPYKDATALNALSTVARQIDYFLLNAKDIGLSRFGFAASTEGDFVRLLYAVETTTEDEVAIYDWPTRLSQYLIDKSMAQSDLERERVLSECPSICDVEIPPEDWLMRDITHEQLIQARIYLWSNGKYRRSKSPRFELTFISEDIIEEIYANTIWGKNKKTIPPELCLGSGESYTREYRGVNVRTASEGCSCKNRFNLHKRALTTLSDLSVFGLPVPSEALSYPLSQKAISLASLAPPGRFRTPPFDQTMRSLRNAIEFFLNHSAHLFASYLSLAAAAKQSSLRLGGFVTYTDITQLLDPATAVMGVRTWCLKVSSGRARGNRKANDFGKQVSRDEYFISLRQNHGLVELLSVLMGCVQFVLGVTSARRQAELTDLIRGKGFDAKSQYLIFDNRKSGTQEFREQEFRPIPAIAVEMLERLTDFQNELVKITEDKCDKLIARPGYSLRLIDGVTAFNESFDVFCDYFETTVDAKGERIYYRQHQLRRFFCIVFFWAYKYCDQDALRWFLGHNNLEHLWHYITEQMPGQVVDYVKANFIADIFGDIVSGEADQDNISIDESSRNSLVSLVENRFGCSDVSLLDADALESYILSLLHENLTVEPIFFHNGEMEIRIAFWIK